jgi:hypothetical protein
MNLFLTEEMARRMESLDTLNSVESTLFEIPVFNLVRKMPKHVLSLLTCVSRTDVKYVNISSMETLLKPVKFLKSALPNFDSKLIPLSLLFKRVSRTLLDILTISVLLKSVFGLQFVIIYIAWSVNASSLT